MVHIKKNGGLFVKKYTAESYLFSLGLVLSTATDLRINSIIGVGEILLVTWVLDVCSNKYCKTYNG